MIDGATYHHLKSRGYIVTRIYRIDCEKCCEAVNPEDDGDRIFFSSIEAEIREHELDYHK